MKYKVTRDVTTEECHWLDSDVKEGTEVFGSDGCKYGCITPKGTAICFKEDKMPFIELPTAALKVFPSD